MVMYEGEVNAILLLILASILVPIVVV